MGSDEGDSEGDSEVDWFGEELELRERVECSGTPRSPQFPFLTAFLSFRGLHMKLIATRLFSPSAWLAGFLDLHYGNGPRSWFMLVGVTSVAGVLYANPTTLLDCRNIIWKHHPRTFIFFFFLSPSFLCPF
jgi:hypothetical protein